jgi:hypothetical protein
MGVRKGNSNLDTDIAASAGINGSFGNSNGGG